MSNIESVIETYVATWNETDPARRQAAPRRGPPRAIAIR